MNFINPLSINFTGIKDITYCKRYGSKKLKKPTDKISTELMEAVKESDVIKSLAETQDVSLNIAPLHLGKDRTSHSVTVEVPDKKERVTIYLKNTHINGSTQRVQNDLAQIPKQTFCDVLALSSKYEDKLKQARAMCTEMNNSAQERFEYYPLDDDKKISISPNLIIKTQDVAIGKGLKGKPINKEIIDFTV